MNELLPYEQQLQQQWTDIPLPDENDAWDDMRRRLEEDDDRGIVFWWRPGCALWGGLLVLLGLGWWMMRPAKGPIKEKGNMTKDSTVTVDRGRPDRNAQTNSISNNNFEQNTQFPVPDKQQPDNTPILESTGVNGKRKAQGQNSHQIPAVVMDKEGRLTKTSKLLISSRREGHRKPVKLSALPIRPRSTGKAKNNKRPGDDTTISQVETSWPVVTETVISDSMVVPDTAAIVPEKKARVKQTDPNATSAKKAEAKERDPKNRIFFSTGITLQQQLPMAGQKLTPYNSQGRKGSLADYIPSVYIRLHKMNTWFLQAEFRYGAPQYSKEFLYHETSIPDTGRSPRFVTNTTARLKKTYYHQLPVSVHYHISPQWSAGVGLVWNKFYAAISDRETIKHINSTQVDSIVFKGVERIKNDTSGSFARSYFQAVIESQYRWKRLSIGARYAFGLQPYIRFTLPGQPPKEEKNSSLQIFLRFELWRSGRSKRE